MAGLTRLCHQSLSIGISRARPLVQEHTVRTWLHLPARQLLHTAPNVRCAAAVDAGDNDDDDEIGVPGRPMRVERLLANLGYGKRRECAGLVKSGRVTLAKDGGRMKVGQKVVHSDVLLEGEPLDTPYPLALMLHKPTGYVVTSPDDENIPDPKVYDLLPFRYGRRRPCLSCVGRLDKNTSGLIMLTDDGQLLHRINSPKKGIWKVYEAELADPLKGKQAETAVKKFESGTMLLPGDFSPLLPARLTMVSPTTARVALCEGKYHQIRRMFELLGREVTALHRLSVGGLGLADLAEGEWRYLTPADVEAVFSGPSSEDVLAGTICLMDGTDGTIPIDDVAGGATWGVIAPPAPAGSGRKSVPAVSGTAAVAADEAVAGRAEEAGERAQRGSRAESSTGSADESVGGGEEGGEEGEEEGAGGARAGKRLAGNVQGWRDTLAFRQAAAAAAAPEGPGKPSQEVLAAKKFRSSERFQKRREALRKILPVQA